MSEPVLVRSLRLRSLPRRLLAAVVVGVATLFQPKADPKQHWSVPPTFPVDEETPSGSQRGRRT